MYATDTILVRDEPATGAAVKFNKLRIVGPSPIRQQTVAEEWGGGVASELFIVEPLGDPDEFCSTEIIPEVYLNENYTVESEPEPAPTHVVSEQQRRTERRVSPEEVFRKEAKSGYADHEKRSVERTRTKIGG